MNRYRVKLARCIPVIAVVVLTLLVGSLAQSAPLPGGTLDPTTIPKYVTPLVIPPVMPKSVTSLAPAADYDIAVRQFKQQILPGGIWGSSFPNPLGGPAVGPFPATTVWSYGRAADPLPDSSAIGGGVGIAPAMNSTFNYPAFTVENTSALATKVRWINDLKDPVSGNFLPHLFNVDQTLHWANPPTANCTMAPFNRTDCETAVAAPYTGPVPFVTHVHGAHVQPHSDGYPEAWWLPAANNIPAGYSLRGSHFGQANTANTVPGSAFFSYENSQPATTLWYHDHALGMTRLNVYAGPAGFWLIRGGANDTAAGILPGPAPSVGGGDPNFNAAVRATIREVPIAIQDRSFNTDGSLFYPADRTFFDGYTGPFIGNPGFLGAFNPGPPPTGPSDMSGIWNPEAFFNTMVVNGTTWPKFEVANARYRLRLLNGCNSRTLNLSMFVVTSLGADGIPGTADDVLGAEVPFFQIGAEQGFLPKVVRIQTGFATPLPGNGTAAPAPVAAPDPTQALLMGPAERADVIVDFKGMANGTRIRMINTAPDAPFGGLPDVAADPSTTGQVMDFIVNTALETPGDSTTTPQRSLVLPAEAPLGAATNTRQVSLNELSSDQVCVEINVIDGAIINTLFSTFPGDPNFQANCAAAVVGAGNFPTPMGPRQAQLGVLTTDGLGNVTAVPQKWADPITESPSLNSTEIWEIYNTTVDGHPIHVHLVAFQVINREDLDPTALAAGSLVPSGVPIPPNPNEMGYKDTVLAFPGQITRIKAKFDIAGLYVWHCHIVEHEDNEMMRPFTVVDANAPTGTIVINGGATFTRSASVTLTLSATSAAGAVTQMQFSKDGITFFPFEPFAATRVATLLPGDGLKTMTVRFKDSAGNVSAPISASITLDTTAPNGGTISINGGATVTNKQSATLTLTAAADVTQMQFSKNGINFFPFEPFAATRIVTLLPGDGTKTIYVRFKDAAGNVSSPISDSITLDTTPPTGTIAFVTPSPTTSATGLLALTASDDSGVTQMQFSKNGSPFFALEPFAANRTVSLAPGLNTLTVRFKDGAGNLSAPISTTITRN
jgi:FtsP/CotA-like multicopper oxidase with cupredoxin domain